MDANLILSDKLKVHDLKSDETATFMLINAQKKDHSRDEPSTPYRVVLAGQQNVTDPYDPRNNRKTIANVVGTKPVMDKGGSIKTDANGVPVMTPDIKSVTFERGFLTLTSDQNPTFHYLMRRLDNASNPFRVVMGGKGKAPRFKLVEDKKELQDILHSKEIHYAAQKLVRESDIQTLRTIAIKMNESPDNRLHVKSIQGDIQDLKFEMIQKADNFPKLVIQYSSDTMARCKVQIFESMRFGILRYDTGAFYLLGKEYKEIYRPAPDEDPVDSLLKFFTGKEKEGREKYQDMAETLKKALKA